MTSLTTAAQNVTENVRDTVRTTVSEAESKVVGTVRDLQAPVAEYVHKGISFAGDHLPDYPSSLPTPSEIVDSQYAFVSDLLSDQYDRAKALAAKVAPLVGVSVDEPEKPTTTSSTSTKATSTGATKSAKSTKSAKAAKATKSSKTA